MHKHLQKLLLLVAMMLVPWVTQAQTLDDYSFSTGIDTSKWVNMSSATQILSPSGSDGLASSVQNIGFSFPFGASTYTQYSVNTDGNLRLGSTVTGTTYYTTPFSATNANNNNPKINAFGCDGYGNSGTHYVKSLLTEDANGDTLLVVEFCTGTYTSSTRSNLYKWQVHMYADGDIEIVYGPAPATAPNIARQPGLCVSSSDGWTINGNHQATHFTSGVAATTVNLGVWPTEGRYYRFAKPNPDCPKPLAITVSNIDTGSFDISWTDTSTATSWIVQLFDGDSMVYDNVEYYNSVSFSGLNSATYYMVQVAGLCSNGDTSGFRTAQVLTACALITSLPYTQNFDGVPGATTTSMAANNLPPCWANHNTGTSTSYSGYPIVYNSATYAHSGSQAMRFYTYTTSGTYSDQYAIMPLTDSTVLPLSGLQVRFWMRTTSTSYNSHVIVGVMTDPTNASTFVPIEDVSTNSSTTYAEHTVVLASYNGPHGYVAFKAPQPTSSYNALLIDDVVLEEVPSCLPVHDLTVTAVTGESISFAWSPIGTETQWIVSDGTNDYIVYDTVYTLTSLTPNTPYTISVQADCGGGDTSTAVSVSARTSCGALTVLPFVENFDSVTGATSTTISVNNLPPCWNYLNHGTRSNYMGYPAVYSSTTYSHSGSNSMRFYSFYTAADSAQYAIMPLTDSTLYPVNNLMLTFQMRAYNSGSTYGAVAVIGVMTNPMDASSFVPVDTVNSNGVTTYSEYEVYLASYTGAHGYVTLMFPYAAHAGFNYNSGYVDDIVLDVVPTCPPIQNLAQTAATTSSVTLNWTEVGTATQWVLEYDTADFVPGTGSGTVVNVTALPYTLSGLDSGYSYYIYVHGDCGTGDTSTNVFVLATTLSGGGGLPYTCGFEGAGDNDWNLINGTQANKWYVGTAAHYTGSKGLYISSDNGASNTYDGASESYVFAVKEFTLENAGEYAFSYDWKCNGESSFDFLRAALVPSTTVLTAGSYCGFDNTSGMPSGGIALDGGYRMNLQTSWQTQMGTFIITTPGTYKWVFMWRNDGSVNNQPPIAIDNVALQLNTCPAPTVYTERISPDSIVIAWHPNGVETMWELSGDSIQIMVYDTTYAFGELQGNTEYHFTVRAICGDGDTSMAAALTQRTPCTYISTLPYQNDFESGPYYSAVPYAQAFPTCWTRINDATGSYNYYPYTYSTATYAHSGNVGMYWYLSTSSDYANNEYAILPGIDTTVYNISDLTLSFYAKTTSTSYHPAPIVGVMTNPNDASTFTPVYTFSSTEITTDWVIYVIPFASYTGHGNFIAIKCPRPSSTAYMALDDVFLTDEWCDIPLNVTANPGLDEVTINWNTNGGTSFVVILGSDTVNVYGDSSYTFTGLTANTPYSYAVANECTDGLSMFINGTVRTLCTAIDSLPYVQTFESEPTGTSTTGSSFANCWQHLNNGTSYGGYPYISSSTTYNHTLGGTKGLYWYNTTTTGTYGDYQILVLPAVDTDNYPINSLQLKFWARPSSTSYNPTFEVGVMTNSIDPSTFTPVDTIHVGTSTTWTEFISPLGAYTGYGQFVAIRATRSTATWYAYVDDFTLEQMPSCPVVSSVNVRATAGTAIVSWDIEELPGVVPTGYNVRYGYASDSLVGAVTLTTTDPYAILNGLTPDTMYTVSVSVDCGGFAGTAFTRDFSTAALPCLEWDTNASGPRDTIVAGTDGSTTTYYMPINTSTAYSYCQHLIRTSDLSTTGPAMISGVSFQYAYTQPLNATNCSIYMAHTTQSTFSTMLPYDSLQLVYLGPMNFTTMGWNAIEFNQGNFSYDGIRNIVVAIVNNSGTTIGSSYVFGYNVPGVVISRREGGSTPYTPSAMNAATGNNSNWRSNMRLLTGGGDCLVVASCAAPDASVDSVVTNNAYISWIPGYTESSWDIDYRASGATSWTTAATGVTSTNYTLSGLTPNTLYEVRVGTVCSDTTYYDLVSFRTACGGTPVPFFENFDTWSSTAADPLPACWDKHTNYSTNYPYASTSYNHTPSGSKGMYMYSTNATWSYMVLPLFAPPVDSLQLDFWLYKTNTSYTHRLIVGVMTDPTDKNTFVPVDTVAPAVLSTWEEFTVPLNRYTGSGHYIAIMSPDGEYSYPYLDDLTVEYVPDCMPVYDIAVSNITQTTADLIWTDSTSATSWTVEYGPSGFTTGTGTTLIVYDTTLTLTGLTTNTPYTVYVSPDCPAGIAGMAHFDFRTACGPIDSLPWSDNLDFYPVGTSSTSSAFIPCYHHLNNGTSYGGYPYVGSSSYNHTPGGAHGLYWYNTTTTGTYGDYQCVVLPELDSTINISTVQVTFWARASSATYTPVFQVGVMTDPTDITTFQSVDVVTVSSGTTWSLYEVPLTLYTGSGHYAAIMGERATATWYAYVDDFTLEYTPSCIPPHNVFASNATTTSLTVDWVDITPAMEWQVEYGPQGYTRGSAAGTSLTTTTHPITVAGLDTLSNYDFYVRAICTVGDTSSWYSPFTLTTAMCDNSNIFSVGSPSSSGSTYLAPVNNYYRYTLSEVILDSAEIGGAMDIEYIGYYYNYATASTDKVNCTIYFQPTTKTVFSGSTDVVALDTSAVKVYTGHLNCSQGWNFFALDTVYHYDGNTNLMVIVDDNSNDYNGSAYVFKSEPCTGNKTLYYYSDSYDPDVTSITSSYSGTKAVATWRPVMQLVSCSAPSCMQPVITGVTQTYESATITWAGSGSEYEVNIKESAATDWSATDIAVTGNTYTFTGLQPATYYTFRVRQDCTADSLGYSEWVIDNLITDSLPCLPPDSLHVTAVTNATATLDWMPFGSETMWDVHVWFSGGLDSIYTVGTHPATVGGFTANTTYNAAVRPLCGSANNILGDWGDTVTFTTAVCPDVTGLTTSGVTTNSVTVSWNADPLAVSWIIEYGYHGFDQGTGTTIPTTLSSYTITGLLDDMQYDFRVRAVCGTDWMSEGWANVSATTQAGGVPCEAPTNVSAVVAGNSATISWTANTGNISYELEYGTRGFGLGSGTTVNATSSPVTLNNLDYETDYDVYVKAICDQNTYSAWSTVASFTTEAQGSEDCDPVTDLAANNVTESSALLTWTPGATGDEWEVVLTTAAGATVSEASTTEHQYALTGLTPGTAYVAKVRTVCGDGVYSTFASTSFTTVTIGIDGVVEPACTIYPNPTSSATTISVTGISGKVKIAVVDMNGREVTSEMLDCSGDCAKSIDVENLSQGAYFVRITGENVSMVKKLIVR